jgi:hypothetical protein
MEHDLHTLAYFSRNAIEASGGLLDAEIEKILTTARTNNAKLNVTGALLFSGGCFAQVLEGPLEAVETLFEQIECDPRHRNVTILHFKPANTRNFGDWTMAYAGAVSGAENHLDLEGLFDEPDQIASEQAGRDIVKVMSDLIHRTELAHI